VPPFVLIADHRLPSGPGASRHAARPGPIPSVKNVTWPDASMRPMRTSSSLNQTRPSDATAMSCGSSIGPGIVVITGSAAWAGAVAAARATAAVASVVFKCIRRR
jgi:hypothetical protein